MLMANPYYQNPFTSNPLLAMMMGMGNQEMNPYEGNGLLHPVYVTPVMMHKLQQSIPEWQDPALDNAKEGNMDCIKGATVSCTDSGQKIRAIDPQTGAIKLKELQTPEKISCFAGCEKFNPCNNNLYSSFVKSQQACDGNDYFYYTCESFEEMDVFVTDCAKHEAGAKIDAPITTISGASKYKIWQEKVISNREQGKGRDIMYDDDEVEPGMGVSVGEGNAGNAPITDEELGNVVDDTKYKTDKAYMQPFDNKVMHVNNYNENIMDNMAGNNHYETLELIIAGVWGVLFSVLLICFCCVMAGLCGYIARRIRRKIRVNGRDMVMDKRGGGTYVDMSDDDEENHTLCDDVIDNDTIV